VVEQLRATRLLHRAGHGGRVHHRRGDAPCRSHTGGHHGSGRHPGDLPSRGQGDRLPDPGCSHRSLGRAGHRVLPRHRAPGHLPAGPAVLRPRALASPRVPGGLPLRRRRHGGHRHPRRGHAPDDRAGHRAVHGSGRRGTVRPGCLRTHRPEQGHPSAPHRYRRAQGRSGSAPHRDVPGPARPARPGHRAAVARGCGRAAQPDHRTGGPVGGTGTEPSVEPPHRS
jgi:hypothetical protein